MIIHSLRVRHWRGIIDSGVLDLQPGFNLLAGPNGSGKSSLLESLVMAFFVKHTSKNAEARAIEPKTGGGSPESEIIFSIGAQKWKLHKRFLKDCISELSKQEQGTFNHFADGDAADAALRDFFRSSGGSNQHVLPEHRGLAQALWSLQRDAELLPADSWCESVSASLSGTVRQVAQDPLYRAVCTKIEQAFNLQWTNTKRVRKGSSQEAEEEKLSAIRKEISLLCEQEERAEEHRQTLEGIDAELAPLAEKLQVTRQEEEDARNDVARSEALQPQLATLKVEVRETAQEVDGLKSPLLGWRATNQRLAELIAHEQQKVQAEATLNAQICLSESELKRQNTALATIRQELKTAEAIFESIQRTRELASLEQNLVVREGSLQLLRKAQAAVRSAQESCSEHRAPKPKELTDFRKRRDELLRKEAEHRASAIQVSFALEGAHVVSSTPPLSPAPDGTWLLAGPTSFRLGQLGTITIQGPVSTTAELEVAIQELRTKNQSLLTAYNADSEEALAQLLETATHYSHELERSKNALADLDSTDEEKLVVEISTLKSDIAAHRQQIEADTTEVPPGTTLDGSRADLRELREKKVSHERAQSHRQESVDTARREYTDAKVALEGVRTELRGVQTRLTELVHHHGSLAQLEAKLEVAQLSLDEKRTRQEKLAGRLEPELYAARTALKISEDRILAFEGKKRALEDDRTRTESILEQILTKNIHESLADLRVQEEQQSQRANRVRREAEAVKLLHELADTLVTEQTQVLIGPIAEKVAPWLQQLTGGRYRDLRLSEAVLPSDVVLGQVGKRLDADSLSHGTREQLAVLVRLAMGQLLSTKERQLLVLDDRLVNSDSLRLARLRGILDEVSATCQVLVATCNDANYAGIRSNVLQVRSS
jgi:DNA repair exonuclease SbcCD ATPase subunit